ncbi:MAG: class B sortase [Coriobacteriales bacterium]|jgi:sortase B|nr:class B sortase [Coriobacteriales bacterium]
MIARKAIRIADSVVNTAVLLIVVALLAIGGYALWDSSQVYDAASAARYETYKPGDSGEDQTFEELKAINSDVFAWLTVYGTHIDYPVAQGQDNMKYVNTDAEGRYSLSGSIFLDEGSSKDFSDFSSIFYGHHMEQNAMFGEIGLFVDKAYFDARRYGALYYSEQWHGLEFFAFLRADAYDNAVFRVKIEGEEAQQEYLALLLAMADHTRDIGVTTADRIVLLSTCSPSPTNGRDILVGRITDEIYENPFAEEEQTGDNEDSVDAASLWAIILPVVAVAGLAMIVILVLLRRKRRKRKDEEAAEKNSEHEDNEVP